MTGIPSAPTLRIGIIGAGEVARWHAEGLRTEPRVRLLAVAEQDEARRAAFASRFGTERAVADWQDLVRAPDLDLILILAPHHYHQAMVVAALKARKHVLCEKPMARTVAECDAMLAEAKIAHMGLYICHSLRNGPFFRTASRLIAEGKIGRPVLASFRWFVDEIARLEDPSHWKGTSSAGGGVFLDGGCRVADLANALLGPARRVAACGRRLVAALGNRGEDNGAFVVEYASGATASFALSFTAGKAFRGERQGAGLVVDIYGTEGHLEAGYSVRDDVIEHYCLEHRPGAAEVAYRPAEGQDRVIDLDFVASILDGSPPPLDALAGRNAVAVVEAAYRSVRSGSIEDVDWRS